MNVQASAYQRIRRSAAAVMALAFVVFAVLVPDLHEHWDWTQRAGNPSSAAATGKAKASVSSATVTGKQVTSSAAVRSSGDCPLCDWLLTATYVAATTTARLLFLLVGFLLPAIALCLPSLCARPSPRAGNRAPPFALAA